MLTIGGWLAALWAGWGLVFYSDPGALSNPRDGSRPDFAGALWFASSAIFTVGNGDYSPREGAWELVASFMSSRRMRLSSSTSMRPSMSRIASAPMPYSNASRP